MRTALELIAESLPFRASPDLKLLHLLDQHADQTLAHLSLDALNSVESKSTCFYPIPILQTLAWCQQAHRHRRLAVQGLEQVEQALKQEFGTAMGVKARQELTVSAALVVSVVDTYIVVADDRRTRLIGVIRVPHGREAHNI